jgi:hypothetical protein
MSLHLGLVLCGHEEVAGPAELVVASSFFFFLQPHFSFFFLHLSHLGCCFASIGHAPPVITGNGSADWYGQPAIAGESPASAIAAAIVNLLIVILPPFSLVVGVERVLVTFTLHRQSGTRKIFTASGKISIAKSGYPVRLFKKPLTKNNITSF